MPRFASLSCFPSFVCFDQLVLSPLTHSSHFFVSVLFFLPNMRGLPIRRDTTSSTASSSAHSLLLPRQQSRGPGVPGNPALGAMQSSIKVSSISLVSSSFSWAPFSPLALSQKKFCYLSLASGPYWHCLIVLPWTGARGMGGVSKCERGWWFLAWSQEGAWDWFVLQHSKSCKSWVSCHFGSGLHGLVVRNNTKHLSAPDELLTSFFHSAPVRSIIVTRITD